MSIPRCSASVLFCPGGEGYLAYDAANDRVHRLNPIASLVAELCDGQRGIEEIHDLVAPLLPDGSRDEVRRCVERALAAGLFEEAGCRETEPHPPLDPAMLVERLRAKGQLEPAYICQYNLAEREPDNPRHWAALGELAHGLGRREEARVAYERYLQLMPYDAEVRHLLVALRDEAPPPRAPDAAVEQLYARFASFYESNMLDELDYQAPKRIAALVAELMPERRGLAALDLGCGSGLAGVGLRPRCARLVGVDLSPQMLQLARERSLYDALELAEIGAWLGRCRETFDLILASDSLIYIGDLSLVVTPAAPLLRPGGLFVFTLELGEVAPFRLSDNGRYTHTPGQVRKVAVAAGLEVVRLDEGYLRMEYEAAVNGLFVALRKV